MVHKSGNNVVKFLEHEGGLYFHDLAKRKNEIEKVVLDQVVETVKDNKKPFTDRQVREAVRARRVYSMIGRPSTTDYKNMITGNLLKNCPVIVDDIRNTDKIFGPDVAAIKGKTVRAKSPVVRRDIIAIPPVVRDHHIGVELVGDIMFVNSIPFLVTLSKKITFGTSQFLKRRTGVNC